MRRGLAEARTGFRGAIGIGRDELAPRSIGAEGDRGTPNTRDMHTPSGAVEPSVTRVEPPWCSKPFTRHLDEAR